MTALTSTNTTISIGSVVLNSVDANGVKWVVDQNGFSGWGTPAPTIQVVPKPRQPGGWAGLSYDRERYMAVQGYIVAPTPLLLNQALDQLYASVSLTATALTVSEAGFVRSVMVRRSAMVDPTRVTSTYAKYAFQVVAPDGRKLGAQLSGVTLLPSSTGGLTFPATFPATFTATQVSGQVFLTNPGNTTGPVILRIDGPCTGPIITHSGTGSALVFSSSLVLNTGEFLLIDMEKKTVLANGQSSRNGYITSRGWFGFDPGVNTFSFNAAAYNAASQLTVSATPAWE